MDLFQKMTADELFEAHKGHLAARAGAPLDESQTEAWRAGWMMSAGADLTPAMPQWASELALEAPSIEVAA